MIAGDPVRAAASLGSAVPAFNIPYLPMVEPVVRAVVGEDAFALLEVARLEWTKFEAGSPRAVRAEYLAHADPDHTRLHLDHVPVIDEDGRNVDYLSIVAEAIEDGYDSVMVDGSRLNLEENIRATAAAAKIAHAAGRPCEAELGAVLGHEDGPLPDYEELFRSGRGFTSPKEAERFVSETGCDWLSVAAGNIHGAISGAARDRKKIRARLNVEHIRTLADLCGIPLVLHGGSGIDRSFVLEAIEAGIAKVNVGTEIRQVFEQAMARSGLERAREAVRERTAELIRDHFGLTGSAPELRALL